MLLLILFAFLAGFVTILSPCILPILPIVLSGSLAGGKKRPLGIVAGFILSFSFFTLSLTAIVKATGLSSDALRTVAVFVIFFFGLSLLLPQTQLFLEKLFTSLSGIAPKDSQNKSGFFGGIVVGLSLGLIWAPCVGPILASVITLAATSSVSLAAVFITVAYAVGSGVPMLAITYGGRQLLQKIPGLLSNTANIQKGFGVFMMIAAIGIYFNLDRRFQTYVLTVFPQYGTGLTVFEQNKLVTDELTKLKTVKADLSMNQTAPDFVGGTGWINSPPLSLQKELKGKVVLVDFWTYSCINCIRTLPYIRKWYDTYKDKGFVVIGVHSPEFEFEKVTANVKKAVADFQIAYPVVQDNDFKIWSAYQNQFWPAHYLIDQSGKIRYTHFGEGNYVETENAIRELLKEQPLHQAEAITSNQPLSPETYLGWGRADAYVNDNHIQNDQFAEYQFMGNLPDDGVGITGNWQVSREYIQSGKNDATLSFRFLAHQVYLVMDNGEGKPPAKVQVLMDGKPLPQKYWTSDMDSEGNIVVDGPRKYDAVDLKNEYGRHTLQFIFPSGVMAFAFTFG